VCIPGPQVCDPSSFQCYPSAILALLPDAILALRVGPVCIPGPQVCDPSLFCMTVKEGARALVAARGRVQAAVPAPAGVDGSAGVFACQKQREGKGREHTMTPGAQRQSDSV